MRLIFHIGLLTLSSVALLCSSVTLNAAEATAIDWLKKEPVSLWDLGRFRIDNLVDQMEADAKRDDSVDFRCRPVTMDKGELLIACSIRLTKSGREKASMKPRERLNVEQATQFGSSVINEIRSDLGYSYSKYTYASYADKRQKTNSNYYPIMDLFSHRDAPQQAAMEQAGSALEEMLRIKVNVLSVNKEGAKVTGSIECQASLAGAKADCRYFSQDR